jgi:hypothetical protein
VRYCLATCSIFHFSEAGFTLWFQGFSSVCANGSAGTGLPVRKETKLLREANERAQWNKKWICFCSKLSFRFRTLYRALGVGAIPSMLYEGSEKYYLFDFWIYDCMAMQETILHWEISIHCLNIYTTFEWKWMMMLIIQMQEILYLLIYRLLLWVAPHWC